MNMFGEKRKVAEIWTYVLSSIIVGMTFFYLIYVSVTFTNNPFLRFKATVLWEESTQVNGHFVVPVKIVNMGHRTPTSAVFWVTQDGEKVSEIALEYLGRNSSKTVYLTVKEKKSLSVDLDHYQF